MAEAAAQKLTNAASLMGAGQAAKAEATMGELFSEGATPVLLEATTSLLMSNPCPHVTYFASALLKKVAMRDWGTLDPQARERLFLFVPTCLAQRSDAAHPHSSLSELAHLYAVLAKLAWPQAGEPAAVAAFATGVCQPALAMMTGERVALGAALLRHLILEFHNTRAGTLGFAWETHERLRQSFQQHALRPIAVCAVEKLAGAGESAAQPGVEGVLALLSEGVLQWGFTRRQPDDDGTSECLNCGPEWHDVFLNARVMQALLSLHQVTDSGTRRHCAQEALVQLCGVLGKIFRTEQERVQWLEFTATCALEMAKRAVGKGYTAAQGTLLHSSCRALYRITQCSSVRHWFMMPGFAAITQDLATFTHAVATEHGRHPDDECLLESLDKLMHVWGVYIINISDPALVYAHDFTATAEQKQLVETCSKMIFEAYVNGQRLAPTAAPDGDDDNDHEREFSASAQTYAALLGRQSSKTSLPFLIDNLQGMMQQMQQLRLEGRGVLPSNFHDVLYVLVSVGAALVADEGEGEIPGIPAALIDASQAHDTNGEEENGVLVFVKLLITLGEGLVEMAGVNSSFVSPLTIAAVLSGLARWAKSYVCPDPDMNFEVTECFKSAFQEGRWAAETFVRLAHRALSTLPNDPEVTKAALSLLSVVGSKPEMQTFLPTCQAWAELAQQESQPSPLAYLSLSDRCKLVECLCIGSGRDAFVRLLPPIEQATQELLASPADRADDRYVHTLMVVLTRIRGVGSSSVHSQMRQDAVFNWVKGLLPVLCQIGAAYAGRSEVITMLFSLLDDLVKGQNSFVDEAQMAALLGCCASILKTYCAANTGVVVSVKLQEAEEEGRKEALIAVMNLLRHVVEWDMVKREAGSVVFIGVHHLLSLISAGFLDDMALSKAFYSLLGACFTLYSSQVALVPPALSEQLVYALQHALNSPQPHILREGYVFVLFGDPRVQFVNTNTD